jgi:hypothetical protein
LTVDGRASPGVDSDDQGAQKKKCHCTTEQIIAIPQEHAAGAAPAHLMRRHSISRHTF